VSQKFHADVPYNFAGHRTPAPDEQYTCCAYGLITDYCISRMQHTDRLVVTSLAPELDARAVVEAGQHSSFMRRISENCKMAKCNTDDYHIWTRRDPPPPPCFASCPTGLGIRATRKFRVGFFGFYKFRVSKTPARNLLKINKTRHFGYPIFRVRVRVYPINPRCS